MGAAAGGLLFPAVQIREPGRPLGLFPLIDRPGCVVVTEPSRRSVIRGRVLYNTESPRNNVLFEGVCYAGQV